ncbi:hypothetical protein [Ottowia thiooxydans]|uniref:hypothetical protein n=1 Tax=Ottowia thiooxydans TaxID=219182 RepID=UPI001FE160B3|nr:hypothetical protein [Ottowia thiooxydans]
MRFKILSEEAMVTFTPLPRLGALLPWALAIFSGAVSAQAPAEAEASKPAPLTALRYSSPIQAYQAYVDQPLQSWREANDRVGQIGGWRAYAKEIASDETTTAKDSAPTSGSHPHAGHHGGHRP